MAPSTLRRPPAPSTNGAGPSSVPAGAAAAKRSAPMALAGLAAVVLGALLFAGLHVGLDRRRPVLVVTRPVAAGAVISVEDLGEKKASVPGSMAMPASRRSDVVGKAAATALVPGSLLAPGQVGVSSALQAGEALVGLSLKAGQFPAGLRPGTRVGVVDTGQQGSGQPATVVSRQAVVTTVGRLESATSTVSVAVTVPVGEAAAVVGASAAGRASLLALPAP